MEGMFFILTLKYRRTTEAICTIVSKINATSQKELELNATLFFSLSNASFSKTCNYYNNDILTLSHGINFMQLIQIDRFHSHL